MDHDLSRSRAILIGNSSYRDPQIPDLPGASLGVQAMTALLSGGLCGWPSDRILPMLDVASSPELARRIITATKDVDSVGVLLIYYVGHGLRTTEGQLALALGDSDLDPQTLPHTAILFESMAKILRGCQAATKLVILDCCHAELGAKANHQFLSADLSDAYPVDGLYFIGASRIYEKARAPLTAELTYFTRAFIDVIQTGIPGKSSTLTLEQIFIELRGRLLRANLPEPVENGIRGARRFPFARNAAFQLSQVRSFSSAGIEPNVEPLQEQLAEIASRLRSIEEGSAADIAALMRRVLRAVSSEISDCPLLCTITEHNPSKVLRRKASRRSYNLVLWCEHPGYWHPWTDATYSLELPKDRLNRIGAFATLILKALKIAVPLAQATVGPALLDEQLTDAQQHLDLMTILVAELPAPAIHEQDPPLVSGPQGVLSRAEGQAARALRALIFEQDRLRAFGGLRRVQAPSGDLIWVCPHHYPEYDPGLPIISGRSL